MIPRPAAVLPVDSPLAMVHGRRSTASNGFMHLGASNILIPKRVLFSLRHAHVLPTHVSSVLMIPARDMDTVSVCFSLLVHITIGILFA